MIDDTLRAFFSPSGVAVVGASTSPDKLGYGVARNLVASGYPGALHFVSQKPGDLFGRRLFTSLADVPEPVELAVLVVPASAIPEALHACGRRGIHAAIVVSAGFRESGSQGALLERQCAQIAREQGVRLLGPNCIGTIDTHVPLDTSFLQPPMPPQGGIAFVSHSGAFCAAIVDWSRGQGFGFSQIVSLGNQADITETEMLPTVAVEGHTRVVVLYLEGVSDGVRFVRVAQQVTKETPVVALKVGRFEAGKRAVASHTGALAASDIAFDAAFAKAGIFRADSTEQMFDWARALEVCPLPAGKRVAVLTDAGGPGVIATDSLELNGLALASLAETTKASLAARLPAAASVQNPVDMLASASPSDYAFCLEHLLDDADVDGALVILPPPPMYSAESVANALIPVIRSSAKPVVIALLGSQLTAAAFSLFTRAGIPAYPFPERAASALAILHRRAANVANSSLEPISRPFEVDSPAGSSAPELVAAYGIPTALLRLSRSPAEAKELAQALGFPLVMKIAAPDILHKSDVGGVLLHVKTSAEAESGYAQVTRAVLDHFPDANIDGVYLQRQVSGSQEVILGAIRDPDFGPLMMFGAGGVEAEGLKDVAFALAPLTAAEAEDLMSRTWAGRRLAGFRSLPAVDKGAVRDALIRLSWLAHDHPEIREIEINPLAVLERGVVALDIRSVK